MFLRPPLPTRTATLFPYTTLFRSVSGAAGRNVDTRPALIDDVASISVALAARDAEVRRLAASAEKLTGTLAERDEQLAQLVDTSDGFLAELAALAGDLRVHRSEEHTSELQSLMRISYAVFCLKKKNTHTNALYKYNWNVMSF